MRNNKLDNQGNFQQKLPEPRKEVNSKYQNSFNQKLYAR